MGTNTGLGIGIGIPFKNNALGGDKPYFPPELKARMIGVWTNYGKKNTDADRNIIKNKIPNAGGDLEILNAAYKLNSGFGEYSEDFTTWLKSSKIISVDSESFDFVSNSSFVLLYYKSNIGKDIPSFKVRIKLKGEGKLYYNYVTSEGIFTNKTITSEEYVTPISYNTKYTGETPVNCGFTIASISGECSGTITQIPNFEDAFVTDGINDMIISQKTLQEMGVTKELTIVSMIHQISWRNSASVPLTNYIRPKTNEYVRSHISNIGKTGIYGYVCYDISNSGAGNSHVVNTILGDKNDYSINIIGDLSQGKFSVQGYIDGNGNILETSSVAHYWTFAVLGKATEDEINLIIGNYNLDRSLKPDILCNIGKQGITNDNHTEFNDKLIDYSGNGRDIQMNNLAWKGGSGIAAKQYETFKDWTNTSYQTSTVTEIDEFTRVVDSTSNAYWVSMINRTSDFDKVHDSINIVLYQDDVWLVHECKYKIGENVQTKALYDNLKLGINTITLATIDKFTDIPEDAEIMSLGEWVNPKSNKGSIKITLLPSYKGGILLDGITDFGKVIGMPIYKDYTIVAKYQRLTQQYVSGIGGTCPISKSRAANQGAFILDAGSSTMDRTQTYSFGQINVKNIDYSNSEFHYQTKYIFDSQDIVSGDGVDGDTMWLGIYRDTDQRFFNGVIYSLMSFPYSMNKFLIERQLKKHKLGTLYPNMVEFRPVIKSSVELASKPTFAIRGTSTLLNAGDYIPENSEIWVVITMNNAADRIIKFVINGNSIDIPSSAYNPSTMKYGFPFTIDSKSPQKITMTIEQDENYVQWNPVVTSNVEYTRLNFYLNNYVQLIKIGDYIPKDAYLRANLYLKNNVDELTVFTFNGVNIGYKRSVVDDTAFNIGAIYNYDSPQEVNITIDEYIRYEDIKQPYPVIFQIKDRNTSKIYNWGDKIKVGSSIQLIQGENPNLLNGLYSIQSYEYEGETYTYNQLKELVITISKSGIQLSCNKTWLLDDNEPKCILSPRLLRIPNASYKILGYIPDISGHGNHGEINNSAYAEMSGANGYKQDFTSWRTNGSGYSIVTDSKYILTNEKAITNGGYFLWNRLAKDSFKVKISNIPNGGWMSYRYKITEEDTQFSSLFIREDGIYTLPATIADSEVDFFISTVSAPAEDWIGLTIEQIGEYEGAFCLDGVNDFIVNKRVRGGKQVLMKCNWWSTIGTSILYDQRGYDQEFAIFNADSSDGVSDTFIAYSARHNGNTYIDGILNSNIHCRELIGLTHNITCTNELNAGSNIATIRLGCNNGLQYFTQMALYDFMSFDEISTDDKIEELNKYIGIEAKVELPPYYWDNYGKTNSDADRDTIQQRGVAVGDYNLSNYNHAYEGMSGYNGYPVVFGANKTWANESNGYVTSITSNTIHITNVLNAGLALLYSYVKYNGNLQNIKEIPPFKIEIKGLEGRSKFIYKYLATSDATKETNLYLGNGTHELPKSFLPTEALINNAVVGFSISPIEEGVTNFLSDITIEVLPEYENGLLYDGITDYSENVNIPMFDDFTFLVKASLLKGFTGTGGTIARKGRSNQTIGGGYDFIYALDSSTTEANRNSYWSFGKALLASAGAIDPPLIGYMTKTDVNGVPMTAGTNPSIEGITFSRFSGYISMVLYKAILYPKTIPLLQINFLKNLMAKDGIINLTYPIFIEDEEGGGS